MGEGRTSPLLLRTSHFIQRQQETAEGVNADLNFGGMVAVIDVGKGCRHCSLWRSSKARMGDTMGAGRQHRGPLLRSSLWQD